MVARCVASVRIGGYGIVRNATSARMASRCHASIAETKTRWLTGSSDLGGRTMKDPHEIIDQLSPGDALAILQILARDDDQLAARIATDSLFI